MDYIEWAQEGLQEQMATGFRRSPDMVHLDGAEGESGCSMYGQAAD